VIITAVSVGAFAATRASLSDQAVLAVSTFSTGTVELQISKSLSSSPTSGSFEDISVPGFTDQVLPGHTVSEFFWLKNHSSNNADLDISAQATPSGTIDPTKVTIAFTPVDNTATISGTPTTTFTLSDWSSLPRSLSNTILHSVNSGRQRYRMDVSLDSSISTSGSTIFDFVFTGMSL